MKLGAYFNHCNFWSMINFHMTQVVLKNLYDLCRGYIFQMPHYQHPSLPPIQYIFYSFSISTAKIPAFWRQNISCPRTSVSGKKMVLNKFIVAKLFFSLIKISLTFYSITQFLYSLRFWVSYIC